VIVGERDRSGATATGLDVALDRRLPESVPIGRQTAVFCVGTCFHPERRVEQLEIVVDGTRHRPTAQRMPRPDRPRYRSGFWATIPIEPPNEPGELTLIAEARLHDGTIASATIGTIAVVDPPAPIEYERPFAAGRKPLIAICMATYNPNLELFHTQVESIQGQTDTDWICLISDDCSPPDRYEAIAEAVAGDDRFMLSRAPRRLSFYRNFERALWMAPPEAELVALSDHDDRWYPDKLATLRDAIQSAELAYSDLRRVDADGVVRGETLWDGRRNNHTNLASLLISNSIVGASCLFRRRVIERALPFPSGPGWDFHDHWLALVAMSLGDVAYVDRPLYDYVQHPGAVLGRVVSEQGAAPPRPEGLRARLRRRRGFFGRWRAAYFTLYLQRDFHARLLLARCARELTFGKRTGLRLLVRAPRSPLAFAWLAVRPVRALFGRNETLRVEEVLVRGILWRQLIALRAWRRERPGRSPDDARIPPFDPDNLGPRQRRWLARR
jgi:glycosyltransferase involved in cell wall biosynthesis